MGNPGGTEQFVCFIFSASSSSLSHVQRHFLLLCHHSHLELLRASAAEQPSPSSLSPPSPGTDLQRHILGIRRPQLALLSQPVLSNRILNGAWGRRGGGASAAFS